MTTCSVADGKGFRLVIWLSGCEHHCNGCHNAQSWDCEKGTQFTLEDAEKIVKQLELPYIYGVTFSGGDPLHANNVEGVYNLCKIIKNEFPDKTIWLYTGYDFEDIYIPPWAFTTQDCDPVRDYRNEILKYIDVLVDGKFIIDKRDVTLAFRGSGNQRIIDIPKTLRKGEVVLFEQE